MNKTCRNDDEEVLSDQSEKLGGEI